MLRVIKSNTNIGKEFQSQMLGWFRQHPEVAHTWGEGVLRIFHPIQEKRFIELEYSKDSILITCETRKTEFKRERFKDLEQQVIKIRGFWVRELLNREEAKIPKPEILKGQYSLMLSNSKYGQVLTVDGNLFTGWGKVFKVFNDLESAKNYGLDKRKEGFESTIYDVDHQLIEKID